MDMFVDKLAQKLTAQEIIKANTAADVEELNKMKNQIAEYNECLTKLQNLIDDGFGKLSDMQADNEEAGRLVEENTDKLIVLQQEIESFRELLGQLKEQFDSVDKSVAWQLEFMSKSLGEKIDQLCAELKVQTSGQLAGRLDVVEENVHKECVKVYRNVQAVMVEESGKQSQALSEAKSEMASVKGKQGAILGVSVAAMILSLISVLLQVLGRLNLLPF